MDEKPVDALRKKRDNSISRCWGMMAAGEVEGGRLGRKHGCHGGLGAVQREDVPSRRPPAGHRRDLPVASGADRHHRRRRQHERQGRRPLPVRHHGGDLRRGDPGRDAPADRPPQRRHRGREGDRADPLDPGDVPGQPLVGAVRRQRRGARHLRGARAGRHLRRIRRQRLAQGRRRGGRVPVLDAQAKSWPGSCPTSPATPAPRSPPA